MVRTIRQWLGRLILQGENGFGLVESVVAVAVLSVTVIAFVASLSTGSMAVQESDQEVVAQSLARTQLEYVKGYPYSSTYPEVNVPASYSLSVQVDPTSDNDTDIQKITVTIFRDGADILTVEDFKVDR